MLDNTFPEYYRAKGHKFFPGDKVSVELNENRRPAEISAPYELQGKRCYTGKYLDNDGKECFLDIPEELIFPLTGVQLSLPLTEALKVD